MGGRAWAFGASSATEVRSLGLLLVLRAERTAALVRRIPLTAVGRIRSQKVRAREKRHRHAAERRLGYGATMVYRVGGLSFMGFGAVPVALLGLVCYLTGRDPLGGRVGSGAGAQDHDGDVV